MQFHTCDSLSTLSKYLIFVFSVAFAIGVLLRLLSSSLKIESRFEMVGGRQTRACFQIIICEIRVFLR